MPQGLTSAEASRRFLQYGSNTLQASTKVPHWKKFLAQFTELMVVILLLAAVISILVSWRQGAVVWDGYVILGIVVLNAFIGFYQEFKADKALEALRKMVAPRARVIRSGRETMVKSEEIVPGDLLVFTAGDRIVADAKLVESEELRLDESTLTGESLPVGKRTGSTVFMGTFVAMGWAKAVVEKTGMATEFGRIARLTTRTVQDLTPLQLEMRSIGAFVAKIALVISFFLLLVGIFFQGQSFVEALLFSVSVAVAAVPEGLPATITVALALGVQRLARHHALVKKLSSVETLGSTTVICSDKTGTLTRNEMTVEELYLGNHQVVGVSGSGYDPTSGSIIITERRPVDLDKLLKIGLVCNESKLEHHKGRYRILGDPTEGALLVLAEKGQQGKPEKTFVEKRFPFESRRKMMSVVVRRLDQPETDQLELWLKGSPESVLDISTQIRDDGKIRRMTEDDLKKIRDHYEVMAGKALRVLALAYRPLRQSLLDDAALVEKQLIFVGLVGMMDPPKEEVKEAVGLCHRAGIRTLVLTGDYGMTAKAIAMQLDLADQETPVVSGRDLEGLSSRELDKMLKGNRQLLFARVSPEDKLRIIDRLKALGEVVAVTGDGVNDAPALKRADIGVAMGIAGTEVSKEAAVMVLTDDRYATIVNAIGEGRKIYDNLRKFVWFIFSSNIGELTVVFAAILLRIPLPLTAALILAVNVGTDILPAIALGVDPIQPGTMEKPPRRPNERILTRGFVAHFVGVGLLIGALVLGAYFWALADRGWAWGMELSGSDPVYLYGVTVAFATLVVTQLVNALNARSSTHSVFRLEQNWHVWGANLVSLGMVMAIVYVPFLQKAFGTVALDWWTWGVIGVISLVVLVVEEVRKGVRLY